MSRWAPPRVRGVIIAAPNLTVGIEDGLIVEAAGSPDVVLPSGVLAPGLIDLQVNGCFGVEFAYDEDWSPAVARLPETGVTAFLPTFITAPMEVLVAGLRRCRTDLAAGRPHPRRARRGAVPGRRAAGRP